MLILPPRTTQEFFDKIKESVICILAESRSRSDLLNLMYPNQPQATQQVLPNQPQANEQQPDSSQYTTSTISYAIEDGLKNLTDKSIRTTLIVKFNGLCAKIKLFTELL